MKSLIATHKNEPVVSSLAMAELFERRHDSVLRAIRKVEAGGVDLLKFAEVYRDKGGREYPMYLLPERTALIVMPFVGGRNAVTVLVPVKNRG
jgi:Rha family phage regulatory protein